MRRFGFALVLIAAIPAVAIPLLACVAAMSAPAAVIAGIAAISSPPHGDVTPLTVAAMQIVRR